MTEEIIIDGVDVAGCFNLDEWKHCNICQELIKTIPNRHQCLIEEELRCEFYTNCYYKQLQRLEQENKKLKNNNNHLQAIIDDGRAENKRFREENEELKIKLSSTKCHLCGEGFLTPEGAELYEEKERYRSALEEIRKMVTSPYAGKPRDVLNIINEVLNEN